MYSYSKHIKISMLQVLRYKPLAYYTPLSSPRISRIPDYMFISAPFLLARHSSSSPETTKSLNATLRSEESAPPKLIHRKSMSYSSYDNFRILFFCVNFSSESVNLKTNNPCINHDNQYRELL